MARPIWTGTLSFGLLNVPVKLMTGERRVDLSFRMLDARDNTPIRYERINADTGEEVPWKDIVKAYEYDKNSYVVLEPEDIAAASAQNRETVEIETFVDRSAVPLAYIEKPYVLEPGKKAEKGYVLLREVLTRTGKVGIGRVVIRTREYLAMVLPQDQALMLLLMRFPQELVDASEYNLPEGSLAHWHVSPRELEMATQLIDSMAGEFDPTQYKDDFRDRLQKVIEDRMAAKGLVSRPEQGEPAMAENAATNVVDFMALLKESLESQRRTPAARRAEPAEKAAKDEKRPAAKKAPAKKPAAKKAAKAPAKKAAAAKKTASGGRRRA